MLNCRSSQELAEHSSRRSCHLCGADIPSEGPSRCARCARWTGSWESEPEPNEYYVFQDADGLCYHTAQTVNVASRYCGKLIGTVTVDSQTPIQPIHEKLEEPQRLLARVARLEAALSEIQSWTEAAVHVKVGQNDNFGGEARHVNSIARAALAEKS